MEHKLKILPQYFKAVVDGTKPFEIRKNDRGFKIGDTLLLKEYKEGGAIYGEKENNSEVEFDQGYTGQEIIKEVTYILEGSQYGLEEGYCILGLKDTEPQKIYIHIAEVKGLEGIPMPKVFSSYSKLTDFEREIQGDENIKVLNVTSCIIDKKLESESK